MSTEPIKLISPDITEPRFVILDMDPRVTQAVIHQCDTWASQEIAEAQMEALRVKLGHDVGRLALGWAEPLELK